MEYVCIIVCVWKRFSLSSSMVSFREELHLKCATLSKVKICSCSCVQLCVHANKGRKKMKTNHLVAQLKFSLSPSLTHSHTLSLISGFQILNLALIWPYFLSAPEPQVLPPSPPYAPAVLYAISSSKHVELSPAEGFLCMTSTFPFLIFQLKGTLKKCSLK